MTNNTEITVLERHWTPDHSALYVTVSAPRTSKRAPYGFMRARALATLPKGVAWHSEIVSTSTVGDAWHVVFTVRLG